MNNYRVASHLLLVWSFWINLQLNTVEDLARRKQHKRDGLKGMDLLAQCSLVEVAIGIPAMIYVITRWFSVLGTCGEAELLLYQWLLDIRAKVGA